MKKVISPRKELFRVISLTVLLSLLLWISIDLIINLSYIKIPDRPESDEGSNRIHELLFYLDNPYYAHEDGVTINEDYIINAIEPAKKYIDGRYDCLDFRMQSLIRLEYLYEEEIRFISPEAADMIKDTFTGAKYWMTEPGQDSMCYWSENHQILYAVAEYLAGQKWPDEVFTNDGTTGREHMERARNRINYWMEHRFYYGFSEFNSNNYYQMNIAPAANFIQFADADDSDMVERMKMCLDLLFYDLVSKMYEYSFIAPMGRAYSDNMVGVSGDRMKKFTDYIFGLNDDYKTTTHHMMVNFVSMMNAKDGQGNNKNLYQIPQVLLDIGRDSETRVIKSSSGLDVSELKGKGYIGHSDEQIMMQLGMEAFSNPEVIQNTLTYLSKNNMLTNSFVNDFKAINLSLLKTLHLLKPISAGLNPMPNGIAIQRANIYTYQTAEYQLATAQAYHPDSYGAQQMLSVANFSPEAVVFTQHPARYESEKTVDAIPGYWAGYGRAPHSVQYENIQLSIYQLPEKSGFLELYEVPQFTHTYLPKAFFDEVIIEGRYAFARLGNAYLALTGANELKYKAYSEISAKNFNNGLDNTGGKEFDLIQEGLNQYWIYELSDASEETFADFMARIKANTVIFNGNDSLTYVSSGKTFDLKFNGDFKVDNETQNLQYKRFDSAYIVSERESDEMLFSFNGHTLRLNFKEAEREIT